MVRMSDQSERPCRVLVVDDEPDFAAMMASMLRALGYRASVAFDGREAMAAVRSEAPDVITLDIQMPGKSGLWFYHQLKSDDAFRSIPVIIVSGMPKEEPDWTAFLHVYFDVERLPHPEAHLDKPVYGDRLQKVLHRVLAERALL